MCQSKTGVDPPWTRYYCQYVEGLYSSLLSSACLLPSNSLARLPVQKTKVWSNNNKIRKLFQQNFIWWRIFYSHHVLSSFLVVQQSPATLPLSLPFTGPISSSSSSSISIVLGGWLTVRSLAMRKTVETSFYFDCWFMMIMLGSPVPRITRLSRSYPLSLALARLYCSIIPVRNGIRSQNVTPCWRSVSLSESHRPYHRHAGLFESTETTQPPASTIALPFHRVDHVLPGLFTLAGYSGHVHSLQPSSPVLKHLFGNYGALRGAAAVFFTTKSFPITEGKLLVKKLQYWQENCGKVTENVPKLEKLLQSSPTRRSLLPRARNGRNPSATRLTALVDENAFGHNWFVHIITETTSTSSKTIN